MLFFPWISSLVSASVSEHMTIEVTHSFPPCVPLTHTSRAPVLVMVCALGISKNIGVSSMLMMNCSGNLWLFLRAITSWMNHSNFLSKQAASVELMWSAIGIANGDSKTSVTTLLMLKTVALGLDQCQCYLWIALHSIGSCIIQNVLPFKHASLFCCGFSFYL